jgi:hypothetical protein
VTADPPRTETRAAARRLAVVQPSLLEEHDASCGTAAERDASHLAAAERDASSRTGATLRICAWCRGPIPAAARRDAVCCSTRCRQARHRFTSTVGRAPVADGRPLRLAYADPPYPGKAWLYRGHPDYAGEVDHAALIRRLSTYDGWALSTSAAALPAVLALCPPGVRVAAWHRGERPTPSRHPLNAWEPVIYHGGRPADPSRTDGALQARRVDSLVHGVSPLTTLPTRVTGTKPAAFCRWVFTLLGAAPGDTLDDLFPGSGAVTRAWLAYTGDPSPAARAERVAFVADQRDASPPPGECDASRGSARDASAVATGDASRPTSPATPSPRNGKWRAS